MGTLADVGLMEGNAGMNLAIYHLELDLKHITGPLASRWTLFPAGETPSWLRKWGD